MEIQDTFSLSVSSFFAAPTMNTFLYRALYTTPPSSSADSGASVSEEVSSRFSLTYSTSKATISSASIRRAGVRRCDRSDVDSPGEEPGFSTDSPDSLQRTASNPSVAGSAMLSGGANELDGNASFVSPSSRIVGRFQDLLELDFRTHHLCEYVDIVKGKHDRLFVVAQHFPNCLQRELQRDPALAPGPLGDVQAIKRVAFQVLVGVDHLHSVGILHRNLSSETVQLDGDLNVHLAEFGMDHITQGGTNVNFPLFQTPRYVAPEVLLSPSFCPSSAQADVWSYGVLLLEMIAGRHLFGASSASEEIDKLRALLVVDQSVCQQRINNLIHTCSLLSPTVCPEALEIVSACLSFCPFTRPSTWELLRHPWPYCGSLHAELSLRVKEQAEARRIDSHTHRLLAETSFDSLRDIFHLWQLTASDLEHDEALQLSPPILRMPQIVRVDGSVFPHPAETNPISEPSLLADPRRLLILLGDFFQRLKQQSAQNTPNRFASSAGELPSLTSREHDLEYQNYRVRIFRDLLARWPASREQLMVQSRVDIPPLLRAQVWRRLLSIDEAGATLEYGQIDKDAEGPSDHQIELDIPRCHQYHHLLSSPEGHSKFRRILKAWVFCNPTLSYWQGLDSLLAPFLVCNFGSEAYAFSCLNALTRGPLRLFFGKSNAQYLQEHLLLFRQLLCYHDPELGVHFHSVGFEPELFAIPWFLTLFTHIFSLDKVYPIWDTILLDADRLPLFFAVSMLMSLRAHLLTLDFNETLLFISNLPAIDFESCLKSTVRFYDRAPPSLSLHVPLYPALGPVPSDPEQARLLVKAKECLAPRLSRQDFEDGKVRQPFLLLDVRKPSDFKASHLPGSITLNHKDPTLAWLEPYRRADIIVVVHPSFREQTIRFTNSLISPPFAFPFVSVYFWDDAPIVPQV